jgi:hypothetical protein
MVSTTVAGNAGTTRIVTVIPGAVFIMTHNQRGAEALLPLPA